MKGNLAARSLARSHHRQRVVPDRRDRSAREEAQREQVKAMQRDMDELGGEPFRVDGGER